MTFTPALMGEAAGLHVLSILFKSGPLIGGWLLAGWFAALIQLRRGEVRFPALVVLCYFGALVLLPLAQTFYTVPLLPMLAVLAANLYRQLFARYRLFAIGLLALAQAFWGIDLALCYPDYNLNGYQWLGARQIAGRPSVGYRSVVQTPSDGVEQVFEWLNEHARFGERVLTYVLESHIIQAVAPAPVYRIENGLEHQPSPSPDYVIIGINTQIVQGWWTRAPASDDIYQSPYIPDWLSSDYSKVFTVKRAFGIEMASVWQKKDR